MNKLNIEWIVDNWKWILFISMMLVIVPSFIYHLATIDPQLKNNESRKQLKENLEKEMKELNLPPKTAVSKFNSNEKDFSVFIHTRYRTEIDEQEFVKLLTTDLEKKGWIYYDKANSDDYLFCRGKADAALFSEGSGGVFSDGGNYFQLSFSLGMRSQVVISSRPMSCR